MKKFWLCVSLCLVLGIGCTTGQPMQSPGSGGSDKGMASGQSLPLSQEEFLGQRSTSRITQIQPGIYRVSPNPGLGFNFPYFLVVPSGSLEQLLPYLLVTSTATGGGAPTEDLSYHEDIIRSSLAQGWETQIANSLNAIQIRPVFPRTQREWWYYTHALNRQVMLVQGREITRLDLQLKAMVQDAQNKLRQIGVGIDDQILINGYSASGIFAQRFTLFHPDLIKAAAYGGIAVPTLPLTQYGNQTLRYPVGIADFQSITGTSFNTEAYRLVPQFYYEGADDDNDPVLYLDSYEQEDQDLINRLFGSNRLERVRYTQQILRDLNLPIQTVIYQNTRHEVNQRIIQDVTDFFVANLDGAFTSITPTQQNTNMFSISGSLDVVLDGVRLTDYSGWEIIFYTVPGRVYDSRVLNVDGYGSTNPQPDGSWTALLPHFPRTQTLYIMVGKNFSGNFRSRLVSQPIVVHQSNVQEVHLRVVFD